MTQAFNLALLGNNVNTTGQLNADTGIFNTVNVANGGTNLSATPANGQIPIGNGAGYSLANLTAGAGITITNGAGSINIAGGGVTSAVAGNGVAVSAATGAVTFSAAAPTAGSVGSYVFGMFNKNTSGGITFTFGSNYAGGSGSGSWAAGVLDGGVNAGQTTLSGTWKYLGATYTLGAFSTANAILCRVS